ncbi:MAG: amidase [Chitinophagales bacterium]
MKQDIDVFDIGIIGKMDATEIAERIKNKDFTAEEVLLSVKERAEKSAKELNAIVASNYINHKASTEGIFAGVPIFIKDQVNVEGFSTRMGSSAIPKNIQKKSDKVVRQIQTTGCTIVGKSATSEFGLLPSCETLVNGDTQNPHKIGYSTGGSSGGSGALVAAGVVPVAHTMDGGGSTRIPASNCGLIGLKPSRARHIQSPTEKLPIDIVTNGIVSRSVRDTANYYHAIEQYADNPSLPKIGLVTSPNKKRLKIGVFTQSPVGIEAHVDVKNIVHSTAKTCEGLGHHVEYFKNPYSDDVLLDFLTYYSMLARGNNTFGKFTYGSKFKAKNTERFTRELASYFSKFMFLAPGAIKRLKNQLATEYDNLTAKYDVILSPTLASPVPKIGYFGTDTPIISAIMRLNTYVSYTIVQNTTGAPAISLPMGRCSNGLPIGPQFATKIGDEKTLLELAFELEEANAFTL